MACHSPVKKQKLNSKETSALKPQTKPSEETWKLEVQYLLDDKYFQALSADQQNSWVSGQIENSLSDEQSNHPYDLFSHQGGGPLGAEWNSDADLALILSHRGPKGKVTPDFHLKLNGHNILAPFSARYYSEMTFFSLVIPAKVWMPKLRKITEVDYPLIYSPSSLEVHKNDAGSSVGVGEILVFELDWQPDYKSVQRKQKAFHIAFGD